MNIRKGYNMEEFFIAVKRPTLNEQKDLKKSTLFRNGVNDIKIFCEKFAFFGEVAFCILQLCGWMNNNDPYFNMVA